MHASLWARVDFCRDSRIVLWSAIVRIAPTLVFECCRIQELLCISLNDVLCAGRNASRRFLWPDELTVVSRDAVIFARPLPHEETLPCSFKQ